MCAPLVVLARVFVVDEHAAHADVAEAEQHMRFGGAPVAAGAADLLIIGLQAARQVGVEDIATSGLSMPMPKAMVATITMPASVMKRFWFASRASLVMPA